MDPQHPSVLFLCPDSDVPTGGIQIMYRQVEALRDLGIAAAVLHERPGFRCTWFTSDAPVLWAALRPLTPHDLLVVPEVYGPRLHELAPGTPKVVCNQNAYLTFEGWPVPGADPPTAMPDPSPYRAPDVVGAVCVSEDSRAYLEWAFPGLRVERLVYEIAVPESVPAKEPLITFMPRKNRDHAAQVLSILHARDGLGDLTVQAIDGVSHDDALDALARSRVFLSFGAPEGFGIPPAEALARGCVVIGYDGGGGREYFTTETGYPVEYGDVLGYAATVETMLDRLRAGDPEPDRRAAAGRTLVARTYTSDAWRESTHRTWEAFIEAAGTRHVRLDAPEPPALAHRTLHDDGLRAELEQTRRERDDARAERDEARRRIDALRRSSSWRLTAPLRAARDVVRGDDDPTA